MDRRSGGKALAKALVESYGPWPGARMENIVATHYAGISVEFAGQLFNHIVNNWEPSAPGPPVLATIKRLAAAMPPTQAPRQIESEGTVSRQESAAKLHDIVSKLGKAKRAGGNGVGKEAKKDPSPRLALDSKR